MVALRSRCNACVMLCIPLLSGGCVGGHKATPPPAPNAPALSTLQTGVPETLVGNVLVRAAADGPNYEIIADLRNGRTRPDGVPDRLWVLQREPPRTPFREIRIDHARVYSHRGELIILPSRGEAIVFTLGELPPELTSSFPWDWMTQREQFLHGRRIARRFEGVGLAQYRGRLPIADARLFR